jgi:hypothetical protein
MRMTLERAIAAQQLPSERPLVLLKSPFGKRARPSGRRGHALRAAFIRRARSARGPPRHVPVHYLRLENREGSHKVSIDQKGIEPDQTTARVTMFIIPALPPQPRGRRRR